MFKIKKKVCFKKTKMFKFMHPKITDLALSQYMTNLFLVFGSLSNLTYQSALTNFFP